LKTGLQGIKILQILVVLAGLVMVTDYCSSGGGIVGKLIDTAPGRKFFQ
jgi:hypothetical protein